MSVSSASSSDSTDTESVQQAPLEGGISPFHMAFGLWCEKSSISRTDYTRLREVWHMALSLNRTIDGNTLQLPKSLDTLKKRVRCQMPMLRLMRKPIQVAFEKLPTLPAGEKHKAGQQRLHIERKT